MLVREKLYTLDEFWAFVDLPENADKRFELINGEIVEVPTPSPIHAFVSGEFFATLREYARARDAGLAFGDACGYVLLNGDDVIPDASFVSNAKLTFPLPSKFLFPPDVAVEVVSPSNNPRDVLNKVERYLRGGTLLVFVAYPLTRVVDACRLSADGDLVIRSHTLDATLDGGDVLPGFTLAVKDVFPKELAPGT